MSDQAHAQPDLVMQPEAATDGPPSLGGPTRHSYDPDEQLPPQGPGKILLFIGLACLGLVCFGVVKSLFFPGTSEPKPRVESVLTEQQALMREALDMAREAQAMQRQRMQEMDRAMYESEFGFYDDEGN